MSCIGYFPIFIQFSHHLFHLTKEKDQKINSNCDSLLSGIHDEEFCSMFYVNSISTLKLKIPLQEAMFVAHFASGMILIILILKKYGLHAIHNT